MCGALRTNGTTCRFPVPDRDKRCFRHGQHPGRSACGAPTGTGGRCARIVDAGLRCHDHYAVDDDSGDEDSASELSDEERRAADTLENMHQQLPPPTRAGVQTRSSRLGSSQRAEIPRAVAGVQTRSFRLDSSQRAAAGVQTRSHGARRQREDQLRVRLEELMSPLRRQGAPAPPPTSRPAPPPSREMRVAFQGGPGTGRPMTLTLALNPGLSKMLIDSLGLGLRAE